jgi:hypothetical protein
VSFATPEDVGSYPFIQGPTSQGSMDPGRAPRWSSAHRPRGVPVMKMTPLQASNLKQEDNLRPQKLYHTANDTAKKKVRLFLPTTTWLIRLSVVGPDESRAPRPDPSDEGKDDTSPGNTPTRLQKGRISKERGVDSEEQHTGCFGFYLHRSPNDPTRNARWRLPVPTTQVPQVLVKNVIPLVLWKRMARTSTDILKNE